MKNKVKIFTVINYVALSILLLLAILTLLFNVLGLWAPWHLAGFGFIFFVPVSILIQIFALAYSNASNEKKYKIANFISLAISIGLVLLTVYVSSTWLW